MPFIFVNSPSDNIWEVNPSLELISEFREFKKKEGPKRSSDILKAIYYIWDPKSDLRDSGLDEEKLMEDVTRSVIGDMEFNWDDYEGIVDLYKKHNLSKNEKLVTYYQKEIEGLNKVLEEWPWSKKDAKQKGEVVSLYKSLFEDLAEVQSLFESERREMEEMLGGYVKSRFERYAE